MFWKRGKKRKGETPFSKVDNNKVVWNTNFKFNGTLVKKKGAFQKKDLLFTLEEKITNLKTYQSKSNALTKEEIDLGQFVSETEELTTTKELIVNIGKSGKAKLKIVINTKCLKNVPGA